MKVIASLFTLAVLGLIILSSPVTAAAKGARYGMGGCGLGSMLWGPVGEAKDKINDMKVREIFAASTNGTFMNTLAIATGTSNCTESGVAQLDREQELFTEVALDSLARDMAAGEGEYITAYATLMGCGAEVQGDFAATAQAHYGEIFASTDATASDVLSKTKSVIAGDEKLSQSCTRL